MSERIKGYELQEGRRILYLDDEDAAFTHSFNLSEEQVLEAYGGIKNYTQHRLDRNQVRRQGHDVPRLPGTPEEMLKCRMPIEDPSLTDAALAKEVLRGQVEKVRGLIDMAKADTQLRDTRRQQRSLDNDRVRNEAVRNARMRPDYPHQTTQRLLGEDEAAWSSRTADIEQKQEEIIQQCIAEVKARRPGL